MSRKANRRVWPGGRDPQPFPGTDRTIALHGRAFPSRWGPRVRSQLWRRHRLGPRQPSPLSRRLCPTLEEPGPVCAQAEKSVGDVRMASLFSPHPPSAERRSTSREHSPASLFSPIFGRSDDRPTCRGSGRFPSQAKMLGSLRIDGIYPVQHVRQAVRSTYQSPGQRATCSTRSPYHGYGCFPPGRM